LGKRIRAEKKHRGDKERDNDSALCHQPKNGHCALAVPSFGLLEKA